jgi:hypothetical protein
MLQIDGLASKFSRTPYEKIERAVPEGHERCSARVLLPTFSFA